MLLASAHLSLRQEPISHYMLLAGKMDQQTMIAMNSASAMNTSMGDLLVQNQGNIEIWSKNGYS